MTTRVVKIPLEPIWSCSGAPPKFVPIGPPMATATVQAWTDPRPHGLEPVCDTVIATVRHDHHPIDGAHPA